MTKELTHPVHGEWLTLKQIAERFGLPLTTVRSRYYLMGLEGDELAAPMRPPVTVEYRGEQVPLAEVCRITGLRRNTLERRLASGLSGEDLVRPPARRQHTRTTAEDMAEIRKVSQELGCDQQVIYRRWRKGWRGDELRIPVGQKPRPKGSSHRNPGFQER